MKCGICGEEIPEDGLELDHVPCFSCEKDVPVHSRCKPKEKGATRVGCSEHVPKLPLISERPPQQTAFKIPQPIQRKTKTSNPEISKSPSLIERSRVTSIKVDPAEPTTWLGGGSSVMKKPRYAAPSSQNMTFQSSQRGQFGQFGQSGPFGQFGGVNEMMPRSFAQKQGSAIKTQKTNYSAMRKAMVRAAEQCAPLPAVTYTRLDRLHDAWNLFKITECQRDTEQGCQCTRCVTMDILTITHIVEYEYFAAQLELLVRYVAEVCGDKPWALASLMPGKSNFWLCGWLVNSIPMHKPQPSCLYLTRVNDTKPWENYPWTEFRDHDAPEPMHIFVLDDVSYSGTQFSNLLRQVCTNAGKAQVHACPLFVTPHAKELLLQRMRPAILWPHCITLLSGEQLFATLGVHRMSKAKNFVDLCRGYSRAWSDARFLDHDKILTTYVPFYKIPDHFSCPEKAYVTSSGGAWLDDAEIQKYRFTKRDQEPRYKEIERRQKIQFCLL